MIDVHSSSESRFDLPTQQCNQAIIHPKIHYLMRNLVGGGAVCVTVVVIILSRGTCS